ncbi:MAG: M42 family metallopeptidase [candidate division Zixibacteria bacterium]|nr:M42 family metallopeptidase [candidate division Zixibacteria bacterium]
MDRTELLLKEITEANGVSGHEQEIRNILARELKDNVDGLEYDRMGSVLGRKKGAADRPRVLVMGHMDEIGFMVKEITKEGYIRFLPLGGWWGHVALAQRMRVITSKGPVVGVVGAAPPHLVPLKDREKVVPMKDMYIDVGVQEKYDVKKKLGVRLGDPIVPDSQFTIMGNKKMYLSKAFDNRVSCAVAIDVMRYFKKAAHPNTIYAGASVQEEVGLRGGQTTAHLTDPDVCIIVDTGVGQDVPPDGFTKEEKLGSGPAILFYDATMIPNLKLRDLVMKTAETKKIPYHLSYMEGGGTDGGRVHISRIGVPTIVIGPPVRYIHSHNGIMNRTDYDNTVKLICELIKRLDKKTIRSLTEV